MFWFRKKSKAPDPFQEKVVDGIQIIIDKLEGFEINHAVIVEDPDERLSAKMRSKSKCRNRRADQKKKGIIP